jgi:hypothetical protein
MNGLVEIEIEKEGITQNEFINRALTVLIKKHD